MFLFLVGHAVSIRTTEPAILGHYGGDTNLDSFPVDVVSRVPLFDSSIASTCGGISNSEKSLILN